MKRQYKPQLKKSINKFKIISYFKNRRKSKHKDKELQFSYRNRDEDCWFNQMENKLWKWVNLFLIYCLIGLILFLLYKLYPFNIGTFLNILEILILVPIFKAIKQKNLLCLILISLLLGGCFIPFISIGLCWLLPSIIILTKSFLSISKEMESWNQINENDPNWNERAELERGSAVGAAGLGFLSIGASIIVLIFWGLILFFNINTFFPKY